MGRKKSRTAMRSHLHDEREEPHQQPRPNANPKPNRNPNPAGAEQTPSGNHVISISGEREKQKKKKKEKSGSYKSEPSEIEPSICTIGTQKSRKVKNKKHFQIPFHWCFNRRALWHFFLLRSQTRKPRRIQVNKITKTDGSKYLENQSQGSINKGRKTDKIADVRDSSVSVQSESMSEPENDCSVSVLSDSMSEPENDCSVSVQSESMSEPENDCSVSVQSESMSEPENDCSASVPSESMSEPENDCSVPRLPTDPMSDPEDDDFEDYCKSGDVQLLWRPPKPAEHDIWIPSRVTTNGEGRGFRLRYGYGDSLVEIFNIEVDLSGRAKTRGSIHGTVTLHCTVYKTVIFNCDEESALMIHQKGYLPLKGTDVAPLGFDHIGIIVDLKIDDEELCEDVLLWDPCYSRTDEWLCGSLKGRNGFVNVTFAVMKQAWLAEIDVKLIKSTKEVCSKIYGDIVVYLDNMCYLRYFAFNKGSDDYSIVKPQESIPLSRSLFTCRCGSSLVVKVNLWDSDTKESLACGALLFPPEYYGESVGKVSGLLGMVEVKVNWVFYRDHSKTRQSLLMDRYTKTKKT